MTDVELRLPRMAVLFGPNASGKSNILDAIQALSRIATSRTLSDALSEPIRGYPIEAFSFPPGGLSDLMEGSTATFSLEADVAIDEEKLAYRAEIGIQPASGTLAIRDEYLATLKKSGEVKGDPQIQKDGNVLRLRRKRSPGRPRNEEVGKNYALLSDLRLSGPEYRAIEKCRREFSEWRTYYLDPRVAMRTARPPAEVTDIGVLGENIAPFLYRLRAEREKHFAALKRTVRSIIPSVENIDVDLDKRRGTLDIQVQQDGIAFSSRIVSEGTLRVLALCAIVVNPWSGSLLAFEEPENGVHPRRLELIADLLTSLVEQKRQVIVTTHSPLFCNAALRHARAQPDDVALLQVSRYRGQTKITPFDPAGPLFADAEIGKALSSGNEDGLFESLLLRGLIDA